MFRKMYFLPVLFFFYGLTACSHPIPKPGGLVMQTSRGNLVVSPGE